MKNRWKRLGISGIVAPEAPLNCRSTLWEIALHTSQNTQLEQISTSFSAAVESALADVHAQQQALLQQEQLAAIQQEQNVRRRIKRAQRGLGRLLVFGTTTAVQKIAKAGKLLNNQGLVFSALRWGPIGDRMTSELTFSFRENALEINTINWCWCAEFKTFIIPCAGERVHWRSHHTGCPVNSGTLSTTDFLRELAEHWQPMVAWELGPECDGVYAPSEENALLYFLMRWSREAAFKQSVDAFLVNMRETLKKKILVVK